VEHAEAELRAEMKPELHQGVAGYDWTNVSFIKIAWQWSLGYVCIHESVLWHDGRA